MVVGVTPPLPKNSLDPKRVLLENVDVARTCPLLTVKFCQPSHEFTFGVGMTFISYPLVLTPLV
jgi:hypothetical protein